jgi:hypothetical protein
MSAEVVLKDIDESPIDMQLRVIQQRRQEVALQIHARGVDEAPRFLGKHLNDRLEAWNISSKNADQVNEAAVGEP